MALTLPANNVADNAFEKRRSAYVRRAIFLHSTFTTHVTTLLFYRYLDDN